MKKLLFVLRRAIPDTLGNVPVKIAETGEFIAY